MKSLAKASRVNTALQVIQHLNDGMKVVEACRAVGIPRSTFYYILQNNPQAFADIQAIIDASYREQLRLILINQIAVLDRITQDGLSDKTKPKDRVAIYSKLTDLLDDLTHRLDSENETTNDGDISFLTWPTLVQVESRFSSA